jgi:hypothetical protein
MDQQGRTYSEGSSRSPRDGLAMQYHLIQGNLTRVFHTHAYHGQAVAHEDHVYAGLIGNIGGREIVCCQHGDGLASSKLTLNGLQRDFLSSWGILGTHRGVRAVSGLYPIELRRQRNGL